MSVVKARMSLIRVNLFPHFVCFFYYVYLRSILKQMNITMMSSYINFMNLTGRAGAICSCSANRHTDLDGWGAAELPGGTEGVKHEEEFAWSVKFFMEAFSRWIRFHVMSLVAVSAWAFVQGCVTLVVTCLWRERNHQVQSHLRDVFP